MCLYTNYTCMNKPLCDVTSRTPFIASVIQVASNSQTAIKAAIMLKAIMHCSYVMIDYYKWSFHMCMYILSEINKLSL